VKMDIRSLEWGTFYDDIIHGNFQVYILSWVGITDPDIFYSLFHSSSIPPNGRNRGMYNCPEVDDLLTMGRTIIDQDKRAEFYRKTQAIVAMDRPYINLWHTGNIAVMKSGLDGFQLFPAGDFDSMAKIHWKSKRD